MSTKVLKVNGDGQARKSMHIGDHLNVRGRNYGGRGHNFLVLFVRSAAS